MGSREGFVVDDDKTYFYSYWNDFFYLQKNVTEERMEKLQEESLGQDDVDSRKE